MQHNEPIELLPVKEIELAGGPGDGMTHCVPPHRTKITLKNKEMNDRIVYEYHHTKKDGSGTEVFVMTERGPLEG